MKPGSAHSEAFVRILFPSLRSVANIVALGVSQAVNNLPVSVEGLQDRASQWRVLNRATVRIGGASGRGATQFDGVLGLVRLSNGTIVVADNGSAELRYFARDGSLIVRAAG